MKCPQCGFELVMTGTDSGCEGCDASAGRSDPGFTATSPLLEPLEGLDLAHLPLFLALPLRQWSRERNPAQRLWRMCDAVEAFMRFLAALGLAERVRGGRMPRELARKLRGRLDRPTFGSWLAVVREVLQAANPPLTGVPEALDAVPALEKLLGQGSIPEESLLATSTAARLRVASS